jgi:hypothetical protein
MKVEEQHTYEKVILGLELIGFAIVIAVMWLDEYVDLPFRYLGALKTPPRPQEFWFEALSVIVVATGVVMATLWVFRRLRVLESLIEVCAWCRKVNVGEKWVPFEQYMKVEHDVQSTHGICPTCRATANRRPLRAEVETAA